MNRIGIGKSSPHKGAGTFIYLEVGPIVLSFPKVAKVVSLQPPLIRSIEKLIHSFWLLAKHLSAIIKDLLSAVLPCGFHHFSD